MGRWGRAAVVLTCVAATSAAVMPAGSGATLAAASPATAGAGAIAATALATTATASPTASDTAATAPTVDAATPSLTPHRVLAVKVPNVAVGDFPQVGLPNADLVYTELVEGGLTRHVAIFSSSVPPKVRPLRSLRETDVQLLPQFGRIGVAYSGLASALRSSAYSSGLRLYSEQLSSPEIFRDGPRCRAVGSIHCVAFRAQAALADLTGTGGHTTVRTLAGIRIGPLPAAAGAGTRTTTAVLRFPSRITATWDSASHRYRVVTAGLPSDGMRWNAATRTWSHVALTAPNVIVQSVAMKVARVAYRCRPGWLGGSSVVYQSQTVGSGSAVLLRGGRSYPLTWTRSSSTGRTTYRFDTPGAPLLQLPSGRVWVFLLPERGSATFDGTAWSHPLPLPRADLSAADTGSCRHPVSTQSVRTPAGATVAFSDQWTSLVGSPVTGATAWLTDADGVVTPATTDGAGRVVVPAARLATGWVRVTLPGSTTRIGATTTLLPALQAVAPGDTGTFEAFVDSRQRRDGSTLALYLRITALGAVAAVPWQIQVRRTGTTAWVNVSVPQATRSIDGSLPCRARERVDLPDGSYELRVAMRDHAGAVVVSNRIRVG